MQLKPWGEYGSNLALEDHKPNARPIPRETTAVLSR